MNDDNNSAALLFFTAVWLLGCVLVGYGLGSICVGVGIALLSGSIFLALGVVIDQDVRLKIVKLNYEISIIDSKISSVIGDVDTIVRSIRR